MDGREQGVRSSFESADLLSVNFLLVRHSNDYRPGRWSIKHAWPWVLLGILEL